MTHEPGSHGDASPAGDASPCAGADLSLSVDDVWLTEWAAEGIAGLERLLAAHAGFAAWLADHAGDRQDGTDADHDRR